MCYIQSVCLHFQIKLLSNIIIVVALLKRLKTGPTVMCPSPALECSNNFCSIKICISQKKEKKSRPQAISMVLAQFKKDR